MILFYWLLLKKVKQEGIFKVKSFGGHREAIFIGKSA